MQEKQEKIEPSDPVIDRIREVRHRISEQFGHDTAKLVAHYMELQERYPDRLIRPSVKSRSGKSAA